MCNFYTRPHDSGGVLWTLWYQVGCPSVVPLLLFSFLDDNLSK